MLHRSRFLHLAWACGFFFVVAMLADAGKAAHLNDIVAVATLLLPIVFGELGMFACDEGPRWEKIGHDLQIAGNVLYLVFIAGAFYVQFHAHTLTLMIVMIGLTCSIVPILAIANSVNALRTEQEFELQWLPQLDSIAVVLIAIAFTASGFLMVVQAKPDEQVIAFSVLLFFGGCAVIGIARIMVMVGLRAKPTVHRPSFVRAFDLLVLPIGICGVVLLNKAFAAPMGEDKVYALCVAVLAVISTVFYFWSQSLVRTGKVRSFVSVREGLLELHSTGWVLYAWEQIEDAMIADMYGVESVYVSLNVEDEALRKQAYPNADSIRYQKWQDGRLKRREKSKVYSGSDLQITSPLCRNGIVELWHGVQLSTEYPSRCDLLPSAQEYVRGFSLISE